LLSIRYHQSGELRADHAIVPALGHPDQVDTFLACREPAAIAPGADLLEIDHRPLAVGRDDADLRVEEVDELAFRIDGVDHDLARVLPPFHDRDGVAA